MGVVFVESMGAMSSGVIYNCKNCGTYLSNKRLVKSNRFYASTGPAYLFTKVVNVVYGEAVEKNMMTGLHIVRDAICKKCNKVVGWMYEFAHMNDQMYKEGMVILEKALIVSHRREYSD